MTPDDLARVAESRRNAEAVTVRFRLPMIAENLVRNLPLTTELPHRGVSFGGTVVVCGAGPSLTAAIPVLKEKAGKVPIIAVNTAAPALAKAGIPVDVLVCIESLDLSAQISASGARYVVLDLSAHPKNFEAGKSIGARVGWVIEGSPVTYPLAYALGVEPLASGGFGLSAALELARSGGASEIVLVGADLGYPGEKAYADESGWGGLSVKREGDRLNFEGREDRDAKHIDGGLHPLPRSRPFFDVPAWGGERTIPTVIEFVEQRDWIARWHKTVGGVGIVTNASVGGAHIEGTGEMAPADALATRSGRHDPYGFMTASRAEHAAARALLASQAAAAHAHCGHILAPTPWPVPSAMGGPMQVVMALAQRDIGDVRDRDMLDKDRLVENHRAIARAAERLEGLLGG